MITVCVIWDGEQEKLNKTLNSLEKQGPDFQKEIRLKILCGKSEDEVESSLSGQAEYFFGQDQRELLAALEGVLYGLETELVTAVEAGETWQGQSLAMGSRMLMETDGADGLLLQHFGGRKTAGRVKKKAGRDGVSQGKLYSLERAEDILKLPACLHGAVLRSQAVRGEAYEESYGPGMEEAFLFKILMKKGKVLFSRELGFLGSSPMYDDRVLKPQWEDPSWYLAVARDYCLGLLEEEKRKYGAPRLFAQAQAAYAVRHMFDINTDNRDRQVLKGKDWAQFLKSCRACMEMVNKSLLRPEESLHVERRMQYSVWPLMMKLACREREKKEVLPMAFIDLTEEENGCIRLEGSFDQIGAGEKGSFFVKYRGNRIPHARSPRYAKLCFFGKPLVKKYAFSVTLSAGMLKEGGELSFWITDGKREQRMPAGALRYTAGFTHLLRRSYRCYGRYLLSFKEKDGVPEAVSIRKTGKAGHFLREIKFLKEILTSAYGSRKLFLVRLLYWLTRPMYKRRHIWLTFDKLYKGGDCGEYFYKYMEKEKKQGVTPVYIIRENAPDRKRLEGEGYRPLIHRSLKQRLAYLNAEMVFATHSAVPSFCGFDKWEVRFVQDLLRGTNTCIQHGLSVQDLTFDSNRVVNNNKRYYCASPSEIENLSKPEYDYPLQTLRLTGIPRYDGLVNRDQKQILITPTWRAYIAMPAVMGNARPYSPEFKHTDYFKLYNRLITDEKLARTAREHGYRIVFLLHPVTSSQRRDYPEDTETVKIVTALETSYEKILTESSLMVTDYSGVQFDFAYMRKPVVYFHSPKLPPHYQEGGFSYETQGFGEICRDPEETADLLCTYMEQGCALKPEYKERQDAFFAFDDHENCKRIFQDAMEYRKCLRSNSI